MPTKLDGTVNATYQEGLDDVRRSCCILRSPPIELTKCVRIDCEVHHWKVSFCGLILGHNRAEHFVNSETVRGAYAIVDPHNFGKIPTGSRRLGKVEELC